MKRKILILGGNIYQKELIVKAKQHGLFVISLDNRPDNQGHLHSDKYYNISTVDYNKVLQIAKEENINAITSAASDVALSTIGYVNDNLNLSGINFLQANLFTDKLKFRNHLKSTKLAPIYFKEVSSVDDIINVLYEFKKTLLIKPVKSSGSKGVKVIDFNDVKEKHKLNLLLQEAKNYSIDNRVLVEEYFHGKNCSAEGYLENGKIQSITFSEKLTTEHPTRVPIQHIVPAPINEKIYNRFCCFIETLFQSVKLYDSIFNLDVIINDIDFNIIEVSPRTGGNCIPDIIKYHSGTDMFEVALNIALGNKISPKKKCGHGFVGVRLLRSDISGKLKDVSYNNHIVSKFKNFVLETMIDYNPGDEIAAFTNGSHRIGHIILKSDKIAHLRNLLNEADNYFRWEINV